MLESRIESIASVIEKYEATHLSSQSKEELETAVDTLLKQNMALLNITEDTTLAERFFILTSVDQDQIQRILGRLMRVTTAYQEQIAVVQSIREESARNSIHSSNSSQANLFVSKTDLSRVDPKERVTNWVKSVPEYEDNESIASPNIVISPSMLGLLPPSLNASMEHISEASTPRRTETQRNRSGNSSAVPEPKDTEHVKFLQDSIALAFQEKGGLGIPSELKKVDSDQSSLKAIKDFVLTQQESQANLQLSKNNSFNADVEYSRWDSFTNDETSKSSVTNIRDQTTPTFDEMELPGSEQAQQRQGVEPSRQHPFQSQ